MALSAIEVIKKEPRRGVRLSFFVVIIKNPGKGPVVLWWWCVAAVVILGIKPRTQMTLKHQLGPSHGLCGPAVIHSVAVL